jgi:hypothetical protein
MFLSVAFFSEARRKRNQDKLACKIDWLAASRNFKQGFKRAKLLETIRALT